MGDVLSGGKSEFGLGKDSLQLSDFERDLAGKLLRPETLMLFADDRLIGYLAERLILAGLNLPISQVQGFAQFRPYIATRINTEESTTSTAYTNLTTVGPELTGLPDGKYLIVYGATIGPPGGGVIGYYSPKINSTEAVDADAVTRDNTTLAEVTGTLDRTLTNSNSNSILMRYRISGGESPVGFKFRWLYAIRYANA